MKPQLTDYFSKRQPSAIRLAQIEFTKRKGKVEAVNVAIGNVSLPMHPAMQKRMRELGGGDSLFADGVVKYTETVGMKEANRAFLNIIAASGFETTGLYSQVTNGGSQGIELVVLGVCQKDRPLLVFDPTYTNYMAMAKRLGVGLVSVVRRLDDRGKFSFPGFDEIEAVVRKYQPGAMLVIPYDNPTGQLIDRQVLEKLAGLCVKYNMWLVSDEAYRELYYSRGGPVSIWGLTEERVGGIGGRRISIESASKVWNACGLRIGAVVTDNEEFNRQSIAENTADLCSSALGQYIFGSLAGENQLDLQKWYQKQRKYYQRILTKVANKIRKLKPELVVSNPEAAIYLVVDVKKVVDKEFRMRDFVLFCAQRGRVKIGKREWTLLVAPMAGFYNAGEGLGETQMRIACVEPEEKMEFVAELLAKLLENYKRQG